VSLAVAAGLVAIAAAGFWLARNRLGNPSAASASAETAASVGASAASPASTTPAAQFAARAFALTQNLGFTREDLASAEDFAQQATTLQPTLARAWGVRAWVQAAYVNRNWDKSATRLQAADAFARRALSLGPDEPEALNAQVQVLIVQGAYASAEAEARHAVSAAPDNYRCRELLANVVAQQGRRDEAITILKEALRRLPTAFLLRYSLATNYAVVGDIDAAGGFWEGRFDYDARGARLA
jgi:tetratricopeptide (TPR) repeat protein